MKANCRTYQYLQSGTGNIGGTLSLTGDYITQPIKTAIRKYSLNLVNKDSVILTSKLKDKAGIVGACMLARSRMFED